MTAMDWGWITWKPADTAAAAEAAIAAKRAAYMAVKVVPSGERTFENTIAALERAGDGASDTQQILQFLTSVHPDPVLRDAAQAAHDQMDEANVALIHDRGIWDAAQAWVATGELQRLTGPDRKLADDTLRDLRRVGFALPEDRFQELRQKRTALQKLESEFERAINEWDDGIEVKREELDGLPERYIQSLKRTPDGRYRVSLQYPDLFPFLNMAHADAPRRALVTKDLQKGGRANLERLTTMIRLRQDIAGMLGYKTHADFVEEVRMSKTAKAATDFVSRIIERLQPAAQAQLRELVRFKKEALNLEHPAPIHFHEVAYWSYRLRKERYALDGEAVKAYFPLSKVMEGMMDIYQSILGVRFTRVSEVPVWHQDVQAYAMHDASRGILLGHFFLDLHPRPGKYGHAAAFPLRLGRANTPEGLVALVCNFPKPTNTDPALLSHGEVETLLHEFGHVMHALLSAGRWQGQNGLGVPLDFVEALSQIFEYWAWDSGALQKLSGHWQTGESLPLKLLDAMLAVRQQLSAMYYLSQSVRSLYDLRMHSQTTTVSGDADALAAMYRTMRLDMERIDMPDDAIFAAGWGHMADYDAGYYGYLWSKVYAADMFTRFAADPLSPTTGAAYRTEVLTPGASRPELDLVRAFLGREPSDAAFLAELGIS